MLRRISLSCLFLFTVIRLLSSVKGFAAPQSQANVISDCSANGVTTAVARGGAITFDCGANPVTIPLNEITIAADQIVTIEGGNLVTLSGGDTNRLFQIGPGGSLALNNITISNGNSGSEAGGAILNEGTLTLDHTTVRDSKGSGGAAIHTQDGTVVVRNSQLLNNQATASGGAMSNQNGTVSIFNSLIEGNRAVNFAGVDSVGQLVMRASTVRGNLAEGGYGGGIGIQDGNALIEDSLIEENQAGSGGGGIYISPNYQATVTIRGSRILHNQADITLDGTQGGGIYSGSALTLDQVTVDNNRSYHSAGIYQYGSNGNLTIRNSTLSNNQAVHVAGGLWLNGAQGHTLSNVTISGNSAGDWGGGIYALDVPTALNFATIYGNSAPLGANLYVVRTTLTMTGVLFAVPASGGTNCGSEGSAQPIQSAGYNFDSDGSCGLSGLGDQSNVDPKLGPLADNGGPTLTHLPQTGSPAIDRVPIVKCLNLDQRNYARPVGAGCDSGAVETGAVPVPNPQAARLALGEYHSCVIGDGGGVKCWGHNESGELGDGTTSKHASAVAVTGLAEGVVALAAGKEHTCALLLSGSVKCWGGNHQGQLGDGSTQNRLIPVDVQGLGGKVVGITTGGYHSCALLATGIIQCWGYNNFGQLGNGKNTNSSLPLNVNMQNNGVLVAAGAFHTCVLLNNGNVKCWGNNNMGALGDGTTISRATPTDVLGINNSAINLALGESHSCIALHDGGIRCWGYNGVGQLGDGTLTNRLSPVNVAGLQGGVANVAAGQYHTCAALADGSAKCWGYNSVGQLGDGSNQYRTTAVSVANLSTNVLEVATGASHSCALLSNSKVFCWGDNVFGDLGDTTETPRTTPVEVRGLRVEIPPTATATATPTPTFTPIPPTPTATETATPEPLGDLFHPTQPDGAATATLQLATTTGYATQEVGISGQGPAGSNAVTVQWVIAGTMLFAGNFTLDAEGVYAGSIVVPDSDFTGGVQLCVAPLDAPNPAFTCANFTMVAAPDGAIEGVLPPALLPAVQMASDVDGPHTVTTMKLLNQAGTVIAVAPVNVNGAFTFKNVPVGNYNLVATGDINAPLQPLPLNVVAGRTVKPEWPTLIMIKHDPVDGLECNNNVASAAFVQAKYAYSVAPVQTTVAAQMDSPATGELPILLHNELLAYTQQKLQFAQTFGIYLSGIPVLNEFRSEAQIIHSIPPQLATLVGMNYRIVVNGQVVVSQTLATAPYLFRFDMGQLPAGKHMLYVAPMVKEPFKNPVRQCPYQKEILVADSPVNLQQGVGAANAAGAEPADVGVGFDPASGTYFFDLTLKPAALGLPVSVPKQPTNLPYLGNIQNTASASVTIQGHASLSGACRIEQAALDGSLFLAGEYACSPHYDLTGGNQSCVIDPLNPKKLEFTQFNKLVCSKFINPAPRFDNDLFNFLDIIRVRLKVGFHLDASLSVTSQLRPFDPRLYGNLMGKGEPEVYGSVRLSFLRVFNAGAQLTANGTAFIQPTLDLTKAGLDAHYSGCAAAQLLLGLWVEGIDSESFKLTDFSECFNHNEQSLTVTKAEEGAVDPGPRVWAAPALASAPDGTMLSVYVEDTAPTAPLAAPAVFARFWNPATQSWGEPTALSASDKLVNNPVAAFYGHDGTHALVAWSQVDMSAAERESAGNNLNMLAAHQEIYYAFWNGEEWSSATRLTSDLLADGMAALAGDESGATLAWTRDLDGDMLTTLDSVIAVSDWNVDAHTFDSPTLLSASDGGVTISSTDNRADHTLLATGMNFDVSLDRKYDALLDRSNTVLAFTLDRDGDVNTGGDRRIQLFRRNFDAVKLDPQPLPPKTWSLLDPQPLPPRVESPSVALDPTNLNNLKLAFLQRDATDNQEGVAMLGGEATLWSASVQLSANGWEIQAAPLLDGIEPVRAEEPTILTDNSGQSLIAFRRFGAAGTPAALGQIAVANAIIINGGRTQYGDPIYLTNTPAAQQWMPAVTLNPLNHNLQFASVQRAVSPSHAQTQVSENTVTMAATQSSILSAGSDPIINFVMSEKGDPALNPKLVLGQIHAAVGKTVSVTAQGRNLGRKTISIKVRFYQGTSSNGPMAGEVLVGNVAGGEPFSATLKFVVGQGTQPIFAHVIGDENAALANDDATGNLAAIPAPSLTVNANSTPTDGLFVSLQLPAGEALAGFRLLRGPSPNGPFQLIAETTNSLYLDRGLSAGATYCYTAQVYDRAGMLSPQSPSECLTVADYRIFLPLVNR
ncbi:MAG: choice-of-anchor Q domain-containing protein [Caldilineaceae bacterium]